LLADLRANLENFIAIFGRMHTKRFVEHRTVVVAHVHGGIHRQQEEADPQRVCALQQLGVGSQQQGKGFTMAELVIAPFFEPVEYRVKSVLWITFEVAEYRDIPGIADLF
jgi:hypothetical protein